MATTSAIDRAIEAERNNDFIRAADLYESALEDDCPSPELIVRAASLYCQCADLPFYAHHHLPDEFVDRAARRIGELFDLGRTLYPGNVELEFWQRWVDWCLTGEEFSLEAARALMARDPTVLITAFGVFSRSGGEEAAEAAERLLRHARVDGTAAMLAIAAEIESIMDRKARGWAWPRPQTSQDSPTE